MLAELFRPERDAPAGRGELERVKNQIQNDFFQLVAVAQYDSQVGIDISLQAQPFVIGDLAGGAGEALEEFAGLQRLPFDFHPAGFEPDQIQQVINQLQ